MHFILCHLMSGLWSAIPVVTTWQQGHPASAQSSMSLRGAQNFLDSVRITQIGLPPLSSSESGVVTYMSMWLLITNSLKISPEEEIKTGTKKKLESG